jgi:uncharacterized protein YndB with AHSA1/START domain
MNRRSRRDSYQPGAAYGADIEKNGEQWTLVIVRDFAHPPARVWEAITDPEHLREWAPFDADRNLDTVGTALLTTVGAPSLHVTETRITRADPPRALEFSWGGSDMRWELEPRAESGTRLRLWHNIDKRFIAMGASGWHLCFDVLASTLDGDPIGRTVGADAFSVNGWHQLHAEYARLLGVDQPSHQSPEAR